MDTFLGTPVGHVWLSPGSSVELVEVHTRKTTVEKTLETALDLIRRAQADRARAATARISSGA